MCEKRAPRCTFARSRVTEIAASAVAADTAGWTRQRESHHRAKAPVRICARPRVEAVVGLPKSVLRHRNTCLAQSRANHASKETKKANRKPLEAHLPEVWVCGPLRDLRAAERERRDLERRRGEQRHRSALEQPAGCSAVWLMACWAGFWKLRSNQQPRAGCPEVAPSCSSAEQGRGPNPAPSSLLRRTARVLAVSDLSRLRLLILRRTQPAAPLPADMVHAQAIHDCRRA
jgi:hypothetical protein